jgi:hypothetical protein
VAAVKRSPDALDPPTYAALAKPSGNVSAHYYSSVEPDLFDRIIAKYAGPPLPHAQGVVALAPVASGGR